MNVGFLKAMVSFLLAFFDEKSKEEGLKAVSPRLLTMINIMVMTMMMIMMMHLNGGNDY